MEGHYFDIQTYSKGDKPDPIEDKIISITFCKFDLETGEKSGKLQILKEFEESQEVIVRFIHKWFFKRNPWNFIPVGFNLNFEWRFLSEKFKLYGLENHDSGFYLDNFPQIDLKVISILKKGSFFGATFDSIAKREEKGNIVKELYENKKFNDIVNHIETEFEDFMTFYKKSKEIINNNF